MDEHIIQIIWDGPYSLSQLATLDDRQKDYGVYQVYAHHPVYGPNVLVYIGKAREQTFAQRIAQEQWNLLEDPAHVEIYVGRIAGNATPPMEQWRRDIDLAEKLLIHAHGPAYNSQQIMAVSGSDPEVCSTRILNWKCIRDIQPEVSGRRWTTPWAQVDAAIRIYESAS